MEKITLEQLDQLASLVKPVAIRAEVSEQYLKCLEMAQPFAKGSANYLGPQPFMGLPFGVKDDIDCQCKIVYSDGTEKVLA